VFLAEVPVAAVGGGAAAAVGGGAAAAVIAPLAPFLVYMCFVSVSVVYFDFSPVAEYYCDYMLYCHPSLLSLQDEWERRFSHHSNVLYLDCRWVL